MIQKNKVSSYFLYAVGEVFLVVIGILIAVGINNWNENLKNQELKDEYISALITDLKQDSILLRQDLAFINQDLKTLNNIIKRLSSDEATIDTIIHIARFEFLPFFNPSNELNRSTINTLFSSGDIKLFNEKMKVRIGKHNLMQQQLIKIMDKNVDIFLEGGTLKAATSISENPKTNNVSIRGLILDQMWDQMDERTILIDLPAMITSKSVMQIIIRDQKNKLVLATDSLIYELTSKK